MTHGSLFSGIGGFDLAAEWMGWQNVFHCEWNEFGQKVLKYYWPNAISYHDITKTDFTIHRGSIDILTGGFPCQPYSMAGKRLGKEDDRHLWPQMCRAIREISPRFVVGENVRGLTNWNGGLVFDEVCADLENIGYQVAPFLIPACGTNAPHKRERIWFVAYANISTTGTPGESRGIKGNGSANNVQQSERGSEAEQHNRSFAFSWDAPDSDSNGQYGSDSKHEEQSGEGGQYAQRDVGESNDDGDATDTYSTRVQGFSTNSGTSKKIGQRRESSSKIRNYGYTPGWETFPTVSPICHGNDGISDRLDTITFSKWRQESIKAGGNAVVPQVVLQIFRTIDEYEKMNAR